MKHCRHRIGGSFAALLSVAAVTNAAAQTEPVIDWPAVNAETLRHFQALVRFDTSDPPGKERPAADYLAQVLDEAGVPVELYALEADRPNVVARLKGSGRKRPLLIMGHTDVVNVDESKWTHPPFGAVRADGHIYGRGTVDDGRSEVSAGRLDSRGRLSDGLDADRAANRVDVPFCRRSLLTPGDQASRDAMLDRRARENLIEVGRPAGLELPLEDLFVEPPRTLHIGRKDLEMGYVICHTVLSVADLRRLPLPRPQKAGMFFRESDNGRLQC